MINIAQILSECPKNTKLYSPIFGDVYLYSTSPNYLVISVTLNEGGKSLEQFLCDGKYTQTGECMLFPSKEQRDWSKFQIPFKDGDIIYTKHKLGTEFVSIFQREYERDIITYWDINLSTNKLIGSLHEGNAFKVFIEKDKIKEQRIATEEEKQKLFKAFKDNGYTWNAETKTLEELVTPKFTDGDIVALDTEKGAQLFIFKEYIYNHDYVECYMMLDCGGEIDFDIGDYYVERFATKEEKQKLFKAIKDNGYYWDAENKVLEVLIEPKFKAGDRVRNKNNHNVVFVITSIEEDSYCVCGAEKIVFRFNDQDNYELIHEPKFKVGDRVKQIGSPRSYIIRSVEFDRYILHNNQFIRFKDEHIYELVNKFDISTLIPFESRVLVRDRDKDVWRASFWGCLINNRYGYNYDTTRGYSKQCIPYEGNEHLLGKTDDCPDFYKNW